MHRTISICLAAIFIGVCLASSSMAIPAFTRKYETSCITCHYAYPKLNAFGKAFRNNGFRYPGDDLEYTKDEPVSLGADSYKRVFPDAVWPSDIPHLPPIALRLIGRVSAIPEHRKAEPATNFEFPHELELLFSGTLGEAFSYFGEVEIENEDNEASFAFPFYLQWDAAPLLHLKAGVVRPDMTEDGLRLTRSHNNVSSLKSRHGWRLRDDQSGFEVWGAGNGPQALGGGFTYSAGIVNGQSLQNDNNSEKDFFFQSSYKFGGLGEIGGTEGTEASQTSAHWIDNHLRFGAFGYLGTASSEDLDEEITALGGTIEIWFNDFIAQGTFMNLESRINQLANRVSQAFFVQGNYVLFPWVIGLVRYEWTDTDTDDPAEELQSLVPALVIMPRANIRIATEYMLPLDDARADADLVTVQIDFAF